MMLQTPRIISLALHTLSLINLNKEMCYDCSTDDIADAPNTKGSSAVHTLRLINLNKEMYKDRSTDDKADTPDNQDRQLYTHSV
jgi:hypothetical protein